MRLNPETGMRLSGAISIHRIDEGMHLCIQQIRLCYDERQNGRDAQR